MGIQTKRMLKDKEEQQPEQENAKPNASMAQTEASNNTNAIGAALGMPKRNPPNNQAGVPSGTMEDRQRPKPMPYRPPSMADRRRDRRDPNFPRREVGQPVDNRLPPMVEDNRRMFKNRQPEITDLSQLEQMQGYMSDNQPSSMAENYRRMFKNRQPEMMFNDGGVATSNMSILKEDNDQTKQQINPVQNPITDLYADNNRKRLEYLLDNKYGDFRIPRPIPPGRPVPPWKQPQPPGTRPIGGRPTLPWRPPVAQPPRRDIRQPQKFNKGGIALNGWTPEEVMQQQQELNDAVNQYEKYGEKFEPAPIPQGVVESGQMTQEEFDKSRGNSPEEKKQFKLLPEERPFRFSPDQEVGSFDIGQGVDMKTKTDMLEPRKKAILGLLKGGM